MSLQSDLLAGLTPLLDPDTGFGTAATYKGETVNVIFRKPPEDWSPLEQRVQTTAPTARGMAADFAAWAKNDPIVIDGVTYRITEKPRPDDVGFCWLTLGR